MWLNNCWLTTMKSLPNKIIRETVTVDTSNSVSHLKLLWNFFTTFSFKRMVPSIQLIPLVFIILSDNLISGHPKTTTSFFSCSGKLLHVFDSANIVVSDRGFFAVTYLSYSYLIFI